MDTPPIIHENFPSAVPIPAPPNSSLSTATRTTRSGRVSKMPQKFQDYHVYETIMDNSFERYHEVLTASCDTLGQYHEVFAASSDPDVMYYHEILRETDKPKFIEAMQKEITQHNDRKNWILVPQTDVPNHLKVLPSVWPMRRKRDLTTGEITKWKARLNVDGSKQRLGIDYDETYAPVASWSSIRLILLLSCLHGWTRRQLDFVQAFPQAPVETELYIEVSRGCNIGPNDSGEDYVLRVLNNIYGQKQAGKVWYDHLMQGLVDKLHFTQSQHDPCLLWRGTTVLILYTDDTIITGPNPKEIDDAIKDISALYEITTAMK